jgi:hypothetical protein
MISSPKTQNKQRVRARGPRELKLMSTVVQT